jgi:arylsulfatase
MSNHRSMIAALALTLLSTVSPVAQQTSGSPGLAQRNHDHQRRAVVGPPAEIRRQDRTQCRAVLPYWPARVVPPKGAPNILLIMTDDVAFGAPSTLAA